ncbi:MAG: tRNA-binding protein [Mycoplasma sp.]|nr:tRNA-binding protein [Candidatus Hennigella equi]
MLNIFYQNKTLDDTLIINVSSAQPTDVRTNGDFTTGYVGDKICFMNIKNISKKIDSTFIANGIWFPSENLLNHLKSITGYNWAPHFDNGFKVGKILKCDEVPGTHLHKCIVDIKDKQLDIVCGAPNARTGLIVVVATNGTMLPSGKQIITGQLLGNKSEGMLCSYRELGIEKESKGIIELPEDYRIGSYFTEAYANGKK